MGNENNMQISDEVKYRWKSHTASGGPLQILLHSWSEGSEGSNAERSKIDGISPFKRLFQ